MRFRLTVKKWEVCTSKIHGLLEDTIAYFTWICCGTEPIEKRFSLEADSRSTDNKFPVFYGTRLFSTYFVYKTVPPHRTINHTSPVHNITLALYLILSSFSVVIYFIYSEYNGRPYSVGFRVTFSHYQ